MAQVTASEELPVNQYLLVWRHRSAYSVHLVNTAVYIKMEVVSTA